jgi:hypothetical protein
VPLEQAATHTDQRETDTTSQVSKGRKRTIGLDLHIRLDVGRRSERKRQVYETMACWQHVARKLAEWLPGSWPEVAVVQEQQRQ